MRNLQLRTKLILGISSAFAGIIICFIFITGLSINDLSGIIEKYTLPADIIFKILNKQAIYNIIVLLTGLICAILLIISITNPFLKQIKNISTEVNKIRDNNFDIKLIANNKELQVLSEAFNLMCDHIKDVYQTLEEKVVARTSEITRKNAGLKEKQNEILKQNKKLKDAYMALKESRQKYENAEDLIKEKEEEYKLLFNKAYDFIFLFEITDDFKPGKFLEVNDYTIKKLGYSEEELLAMSPADLTAVESTDSSGEDPLTSNLKFESIWEAKNGSFINVEINSHNFKIQNKNVAIAIARDITERKHAEEEIRYVNEELINQKENLEALIDNLTQTQEQLVQSEKMAALGQLIAGIAHEINTPLGAIKASIGNLNDSLDKALNELPAFVTGSTSEDLKTFIKVLDLSSNAVPNIPSREKRRFRKEIAKALVEANIDNPDIIADILIYLHIFEKYQELIELLKNKKSIDILRIARDFASIQKNTHTILLAVEKATKVVFALKKYVHRGIAGEKVPTDIIDGIETVLTLYQNQLKHGIEVVKNYETLPLVSCDQDEINQVWTNLIHNAIHAMNNKGLLKIAALNKGDYVVVSIADNGCGIEPDIQNKIFDPFFTTKKQGEGSGLGLDIVNKIVEKHDGKINFNSELGKGTEFTVELPVK